MSMTDIPDSLWPLNAPLQKSNKPHVVPVGLNFGPTWLSVVFFKDDDDGEYYTGIPGGELYKRVFQDSLSKKVQCSLECRPNEDPSTSTVSLITSREKATQLMETFSEHIKSAVNMGAMALDCNPAFDFKLMAVTVPDHWGQSARTLVASAAKLAGHPLDGSSMIIPLSRAIQSTYEMSRYTEGRYVTLLLDYNKSYLHLMLVEMCGTDCDMKRQVYFPQFGEDELHKAPIVSSMVASGQKNLSHNVVQDERPAPLFRVGEEVYYNPSSSESSSSDLIFPIGDVHTDSFPEGDAPPSVQPRNEDHTEHRPTDPPVSHESDENRTARPDKLNGQHPICRNRAAHFKPITDTVSDFLTQTTITEVFNAAGKQIEPSHTVDDLRHAVRDLQYIVIDGEASRAGLSDLRDAITSQFAKEEWINVKGNMPDCGAYGAALAARRQFENPKHLGDWKDLPGYVPGRLTE